MSSLKPMNSLLLDRLLDRTPLTLAPETTVADAIAQMGQASTPARCVLVLEGGQPVGMLTESEIVQLVAAGSDLTQLTLSAVITRPVTPFTVSAEQELLPALALMQQHGIDYLPVVDSQGQFLGIITPQRLTSIVLESHKWSEEKKLLHLQRIQTVVQHMTHLLNDVLVIGKADSGNLELKPTALNLVEFCAAIVETMQATAKTHTIVFRPQQPDLPAYLDEKLLHQILTNLLLNAEKYSSQGSIVYFDLRGESDVAMFQVQDQGIGIPEADRAQIFNSFNRGSNIGNISGTGLGLAIVKKLVELQGGQIELDSEVGVSTTFTVTLLLKPQA
jgi:signal transduction histidine kinase